MLKYVLSKGRLFIDEIDQDIPESDIYIADGEKEKEIEEKLSRGGYELGVKNGLLEAVPIKKYIPEFYQQAEINEKALALLNRTDWISNKYTDTVIINKTLTESEFLEKYGEILSARQDARDQIKDLTELKVLENSDDTSTV